MNNFEKNTRLKSKDINIMDTDAGDDDESTTDEDNVCMGSPVVNVEDDSLSPDLSSLNVDNQDPSSHCDISDLLSNTGGGIETISDLEVLDSLRLSSDQQTEDNLHISMSQTGPSSPGTSLASHTTTLSNNQNSDSDIDLLKPVVFSSTHAYLIKSGINISKPLVHRKTIATTSCDLTPKTSALHNPSRESTAVTSVLPNAMMTTLLNGSRINCQKVYNNSASSSDFQSSHLSNWRTEDNNDKMCTSHKNNPLQISSNSVPRRIATELGRHQTAQKPPGKSNKIYQIKVPVLR